MIITVLFTDIESSTVLTQKLGDHAAHKLIGVHDKIVQTHLKECQGKVVKHTGDGVMAAFRSASGAIECANSIQRAIHEYNQKNHTDLVINIGISAGEPIIQNNDLFGTTVQMAARICSYARGGEILVADVIKQLLDGKLYKFHERGQVNLKGIDRAIPLHAVQWQKQRR